MNHKEIIAYVIFLARDCAASTDLIRASLELKGLTKETIEQVFIDARAELLA